MKIHLNIIPSVTNYIKHNLFKKIIFIFFLFLTSSWSFAATYYVSPNGSDSNSGTESQPWKTIQKAAETLVAGDIVYIKAGTYNESVIPKNSGNTNNYIVYSAYPGDVVTIDGSGISLPDYMGLFDMMDLSFIRVTGLRIINAGPNDNNPGMLLENCKNMIIEKNYTYNTLSSGIGVWNCENITVDGNEVELACNYGEQECISIAETKNFEVKNNHVHHGGPEINGAEGICLKDGSSNGKIFDNHVHDLPDTPGIYVDAWDKHTYNMEIYRNVVHDCGSDGIGLASEQGGLLENINVYNNIVYKNKWVGILVSPNGDVPNSPMKKLKIINNTVYDNGLNAGNDPWGGGIGVESSNLSDVVIRNNIVSQNLFFQIAVESYGQNFVIDFNLIHGFRGEIGEETQGIDYVEEDPMFINVSEKNFHLQENSPAINKGSSNDAPAEDYDGNPRPLGGDYDIGAFEYGQTSVESGKVDENISSFRLFQNYPNPFNPETNIKYQLPNEAFVEITIFNLSGQRIITLLKKYQNAGSFELKWDGRNEMGEQVVSGIYVYQLKNDEFVSTKKMMLIR